MHETKQELIVRHGLRCMYCGREVKYREIQWHHIKPKYVSKANHEEADNSYENGSLLCTRCHTAIHKFLWWDEEYQEMTRVIENHKSASE
jgi:5-methylcytosine-specific restriction endonuclease McrA